MSVVNRIGGLQPRASLSYVERPIETATPANVWIGMLLLAAIVSITNFDFRVNVDHEHFSVDWQLIMRLALCAACGLYGLYFLPRYADHIFRFPGVTTWLFAGWAVCTVPFSIDVFYCAAAVFALWCAVLFAPAVLIQLGRRRVVHVIMVTMLVFVFGSWLLYFFIPVLGRSKFEMPDGEIIYRVGNDAQQLGIQATWAVGMMLILATERFAQWKSFIIPIAICLVTLPFCQSRTATLAMLAVISLVLWRTSNRSLVVGAALVGVLIACVAAFVLVNGIIEVNGNAMLSGISRSGKVEEIYNLTGRTDIWRYTIGRIQEAPLTGHGYGCSRQALTTFLSDGYGDFALHHAHNVLLNTIVGTGLLGGAILLAMLGSLVFGFLRKPELFPDIVLAAMFVAGLTESVFFGPMPRSHTVIWLIALYWRQIPPSLDSPDKWSSEKELA